MTEDEKERIVSDLINLTPRQAYTDLSLFDLELRSRYAVDNYVFKMFYKHKTNYHIHHTSARLKGTESGVHNRRVNRVWGRIKPAVDNLWRNGAPGIYAVLAGKYSGSDKIGHVYAADKESALELANMCFGYIASQDEKIFVQFVSTDGPEKISVHNEIIVKSLAGEKNRIEEVVENSEKILGRIKILLNALKIAESIMKKV